MEPGTSSSARIVIIGAGFAGAGTGAAFVDAGETDVLVLDREPTPGVHSSGRNAGMIRRATEDTAVAALTAEGADTIVGLDVPFHRTRSLLVGARSRIPARVTDQPGHRWISAEEACAMVPLLEGAAIEEDVLLTESDGIVEVHALLVHYLEKIQAAGGRVQLGTRVTDVLVDGGQVQGVRTDDGVIRCEHVVVAAGAWASVWGERGGVPVTVIPHRRHLIATPPLGDDLHPWEARWPWVWDIPHGYYFRPESFGLLWSPCDEMPDEPGPATADPVACSWLAEKVTPVLPLAAGMRPSRHWAGHRSFTPDRHFLLGPDPRLAGWHWAVGLGGHGVTSSPAVGRRVAGAALGTLAIEPALAWREDVVPA